MDWESPYFPLEPARFSEHRRNMGQIGGRNPCGSFLARSDWKPKSHTSALNRENAAKVGEVELRYCKTMAGLALIVLMNMERL
jgi:hypothetical protein